VIIACVAALDPEFRQHTLAERIVRGAVEGDPVRLHGAILAALELHAAPVALADIFRPALRAAHQRHGADCRDVIAQAISDQLRSGLPRAAE
jgi:hypothetical protein